MAGARKSVTESPVGLVAGGGLLPLEIIYSLHRSGRDVVTAAVTGEAQPEVLPPSDNLKYFDWGEIGKILKFFRTHGCQELILAGSITRRPNFMSIVGDPGTMIRLPKIINAMRGGDDTLLRRVIRLIEDEGFHVLSLEDVVPDLLAPIGQIGNHSSTTDSGPDLARGAEVLAALSAYDVGQGCVIDNGRVLAIEAAEGTDAMLNRIQDLRRGKRLNTQKQSGTFIKAAKKGQDMRVDLPTIGLETIERVVAAQLKSVALEARKVIILERERVVALADRHNISLIGFSMGEDDA